MEDTDSLELQLAKKFKEFSNLEFKEVTDWNDYYRYRTECMRIISQIVMKRNFDSVINYLNWSFINGESVKNNGLLTDEMAEMIDKMRADESIKLLLVEYEQICDDAYKRGLKYEDYRRKYKMD